MPGYQAAPRSECRYCNWTASPRPVLCSKEIFTINPYRTPVLR